MKAVNKTFYLMFPYLFLFIFLIYLLSSASSGLTSLSVSSPLSPSLFFICFFCSLLRYLCCLPKGVHTAQTQWSGVPDGLAGGRIATDPSAAFLLPPPNPRGSGKVQTFSGRMRGRGQGEGPRAEGGLCNSRSCQQLTLVLKQF